MPSPTTGLQIIEDSLGLTNSVGVDQTLTAVEVSDSLRAFNDLLEIFSVNDLAVYGQANQTFNTIANQGTYTIGSGGDFNTVRPVRINSPMYTTFQGVTFPCVEITQQQYNLIAVKGQTQQFADLYLYVNSFPLGILTFWPVPSAVLPITMSIDREITAIASAAATLSFPPGYAMVFKYKLAIMLAPMFGKKVSNYPDVVAIANSSFADICRANRKQWVMRIDQAFMQDRYTIADYYRGW